MDSNVRRYRLIAILCAGALIASLPSPLVVAAAPPPASAGQPVATPGAGPVPVSLPLTSHERHGLKPGQQAPVEPPRLAVQDQLSGPVGQRPHGGGGGGGGAVPPASNLFLLPGLAVGDTSVELFFDAPDTGWAQGIVSLSPASDQGTVLHQASFTFAELQQTPCDSPARLCVTLRNDDGWTLDPAKTFVVTVTLAAADGTKSVLATSSVTAPRQLPVPSPVPSSGLRGGSGTGSTGRTADPVLRGFGVNAATGAFTQHAVDAVMRSSYAINVSAERSYSSEDPTSGLMGVGWAFSYGRRGGRTRQACQRAQSRSHPGPGVWTGSLRSLGTGHSTDGFGGCCHAGHRLVTAESP